jgi:hypothetical protein
MQVHVPQRLAGKDNGMNTLGANAQVLKNHALRPIFNLNGINTLM